MLCENPHCLLLCLDQILDIEKEIDYGQIEELICMAKDELGLIEYYYGMNMITCNCCI